MTHEEYITKKRRNSKTDFFFWEEGSDLVKDLETAMKQNEWV